MANYRSYQYTLKQVESLVDYYNSMLKRSLKTHFLSVQKFVPSIDNGKGYPSKDVYIGVDLEKSPSSLGPVHEAFASVEKELRREHKLRVCYYVRTKGK